jgi:tRNA threonylcarbamoyladenosine biosynthesis protein TsaB
LRILAIETSTRRGTVALVEDRQPVVALSHDQLGAHAERVLGLIDSALAQAAWARHTLDRIAVGIGPGSFTGIRVGIALAQGIALGLARPLVGVASLQAMARAVPPSVSGLRCPLLDARRGEVFAAGYDPEGGLRLEPRVLGRSEALGRLAELCPGERVLVGEVVSELGATPGHQDPTVDLPHATWVAILANDIRVDGRPVEPVYLRQTDAVLPELGPNPLANPFQKPNP